MTSENATPGADESELERLEKKIASIEDPDIRAVLESRIRDLRAKLPEKPVAPEPAVADEPLLPPTQEQLDRADGFIRQAQVEKMRGNKQAASDLLKKAAEAAPTSPAVLETLGDNAIERRNYKEARAAYEKALKVSPKSIGLERKHAAAVLNSQSALTIEDQLRLGMKDSVFITADDITANRKAAMILNAFAPGVGQIAVGQTTKGIVYLAIWIVCIASIVLLRGDLSEMTKSIAGQPAHPSMVVLIPALVGLVVYFVALIGLKGGDASHAAHKVDHPRPPVDLPFE